MDSPPAASHAVRDTDDDVCVGAGTVCGEADFIRALVDLQVGPVMLMGPTMDAKVASELSLRLAHLGIRMAEHPPRRRLRPPPAPGASPAHLCILIAQHSGGARSLSCSFAHPVRSARRLHRALSPTVHAAHSRTMLTSCACLGLTEEQAQPLLLLRAFGHVQTASLCLR